MSVRDNDIVPSCTKFLEGVAEVETRPPETCVKS